MKPDKEKIKMAFVDRDGVLIHEPEDTKQIDSIEKLRILPGVIEGLRNFLAQGYKLIMVTNQDGLGTSSFPTPDFEGAHNRMLDIMKQNGIEFYRIFICPHFK